MARFETRRAVTALMLLAPVPLLGVLAAMVVAPGPLGTAIFVSAKVWLVAFPLAWWWRVEGRRPSLGLWRPRGVTMGLLSGAAMAASILVLGTLLLPRIDPSPLHQRALEMGLAAPLPYLAAAAAWTLVNSLVEELVYRWFILRQCEHILRPLPAAALQTGIFTVHHTLALSTYLTPAWTAAASAGVLLAGLVWAVMIQRYRSLWSPWLSHVLADAAVFALGWRLLFG